MIPSEDNPVCIECGLFRGCRSPFMESAGSDTPEILIIGEAPGEDEDRQGTPFVGRSGTLLRQVLDEVGIAEDNIRFTNVVRCRPPDNKITKQDIMRCRQFAMADIVYYQPQTVFLLGNSPLNGILGETGITNWNGSILEKQLEGMEQPAQFVPLYHPAYVLRDMSNLDAWIEAIFKAVEGDENEHDVIELVYPRTKQELDDMYAYLIE